MDRRTHKSVFDHTKVCSNTQSVNDHTKVCSNTQVFFPKRTTTVATSTAKMAKPIAAAPLPPNGTPVPTAPVSAEKAALGGARETYVDLQRPLGDARAAVSALSASFDVSVSVRESAQNCQKRAVEAKRTLLRYTAYKDITDEVRRLPLYPLSCTAVTVNIPTSMIKEANPREGQNVEDGTGRDRCSEPSGTASPFQTIGGVGLAFSFPVGE